MSSKDEQLNLLIYKSRCKGLATWDVVNSILASSERNNPEDGITGVLVATETLFLWVAAGLIETINTIQSEI